MARQGTSNERDASGGGPFDDEKTVKIRVPDIGPPPNDAPDRLRTTMVDARPVQTPALSVLPFREGSPAIPPPVSPASSAPQTPDFTGTVTLSLNEQLRAEIQRATPFAAGSAPSPVATPVVAPAPNVQSSLGGLPDAFRAHLSAVAPVAASPRTIGEAAVAGVLNVSNEAARTANAMVEARPRMADAGPVEAYRDPIVLLYRDRASIPRIVRKPAWQKILDAMEDEPIDPEADDPALSSDPLEIQEQAQIYAILKRGRVIDVTGARAALDAAAAKQGRFAPPIELLEGEFELMFDEVEHLRALAAVIMPLAKGQEKLEQALAAASQLLETAGARNIAPLARRHRVELRTAYLAGKQAMHFDEINTLVLRGILEERKYQKQRVLGGEHICARFLGFGAKDAEGVPKPQMYNQVIAHDEPQIIYIPAEAGAFLPLSHRFFARTIVEINFAQDDEEMGYMAWRCLALGHVVRRNRRA